MAEERRLGGGRRSGDEAGEGRVRQRRSRDLSHVTRTNRLRVSFPAGCRLPGAYFRGRRVTGGIAGKP